MRRRLPEPEPRPCAHCGNIFTPRRKSPGRRYCSGYCQRIACLAVNDSERQRDRGRKGGAAGRGRGEGKSYPKLDGRHAHRVIAEQALGRPLTPGEIVHHLDENKQNYRPDNLKVLTSQGEHARLHNTGRRCPSGCTCGRHRKEVMPSCP